MAKTKTVLEGELRENILHNLTDLLTTNGEDVLRVHSTKIAYPTKDSEGNEYFALITVTLPKGSKLPDGTFSGFDGYEMATEYAEDVAQKLKKAETAKKNKKAPKGKGKPVEVVPPVENAVEGEEE